MKAYWFPGLLAAMLGVALLLPGTAGAEDGSNHSSLYFEEQQSIQELSQLSGEDFEIGYINRTIPHHEGALEMAQVMVYKAPNKETRDLSEMAIKGQATQINQLATLLQQNHGQAVEPDPAFMLPRYLSQALRDSSPEAAEAQYLLMLREHHQAVIEMSRMLLERRDLPHYEQLAPIAQMVVDSQTQQQEQLASMSQRYYGIEAPTPISGDIPLGMEIALQTLNLPETGGTALPETGGMSVGGQNTGALVLSVAGLGLLALGLGVHRLRRRFG